MDDVVRRRDPLDQDAGEARECDGDRGDLSGLEHQEERPAEQECHRGTVGLAQEDVLAPCARHHGPELRAALGARQRHDAGHTPRAKQPARGSDQPRGLRRYDEDAGADQDPDDEGGGVELPKPALERARDGLDDRLRRSAAHIK
jgi:hypothetical protein